MKEFFGSMLLATIVLVIGLFLCDYIFLKESVFILKEQIPTQSTTQHYGDAQKNEKPASGIGRGLESNDGKESHTPPQNHGPWGNKSEVTLSVWTFFLFVVTAFLAAFTYKLWGATTQLMERTENSTAKIERAYVFCARCHRTFSCH